MAFCAIDISSAQYAAQLVAKSWKVRTIDANKTQGTLENVCERKSQVPTRGMRWQSDCELLAGSGQAVLSWRRNFALGHQFDENLQSCLRNCLRHRFFCFLFPSSILANVSSGRSVSIFGDIFNETRSKRCSFFFFKAFKEVVSLVHIQS